MAAASQRMTLEITRRKGPLCLSPPSFYSLTALLAGFLVILQVGRKGEEEKKKKEKGKQETDDH